MNRIVNTYSSIIGFHHYPDAPEWCAYLANRHRHNFIIKCGFKVNGNDREIEINEQQREIETFLDNNFGYPCEFGPMSCEAIAEFILSEFEKMVECQVLEDGYGGATLTR